MVLLFKKKPWYMYIHNFLHVCRVIIFYKVKPKYSRLCSYTQFNIPKQFSGISTSVLKVVFSKVFQTAVFIWRTFSNDKMILRCIHHFKTDLINNMGHMRISVTEPILMNEIDEISAIILSFLSRKLLTNEPLYDKRGQMTWRHFSEERTVWRHCCLYLYLYLAWVK